ncbi:hypothetical protein Tco_0401508 [Tanacetum coccineum]
MAEYSQKWRNGTSSRARSTKTSDGLAAIQAQLNNLEREIKKVNEKVYAAQFRCELCKGPHYTKDCPQKEEGKTLEEAYYTQHEPYPVSEAYDVMILDAHSLPQKEKDPKSFTLPYFIRDICFDKALVDLRASELLKIAENVILDIPEDKDVPLILERPFLSTAHSKIDVFENKITLRVGDKKLVFKESDESFDPTYGEYLELNDLETPLETKTNQDDGFMLIFVKTGPYKIEFSYVIGCKYVIADLFPSLPINPMTKSFYYSIFGNKDEGKSQAETLIDIPVFVGKFSIISGFTIIDDDEIISQH